MDFKEKAKEIIKIIYREISVQQTKRKSFVSDKIGKQKNLQKVTQKNKTKKSDKNGLYVINQILFERI